MPVCPYIPIYVPSVVSLGCPMYLVHSEQPEFKSTVKILFCLHKFWKCHKYWQSPQAVTIQVVLCQAGRSGNSSENLEP